MTSSGRLGKAERFLGVHMARIRLEMAESLLMEIGSMKARDLLLSRGMNRPYKLRGLIERSLAGRSLVDRSLVGRSLL